MTELNVVLTSNRNYKNYYCLMYVVSFLFAIKYFPKSFLFNPKIASYRYNFIHTFHILCFYAIFAIVNSVFEFMEIFEKTYL